MLAPANPLLAGLCQERAPGCTCTAPAQRKQHAPQHWPAGRPRQPTRAWPPSAGQPGPPPRAAPGPEPTPAAAACCAAPWHPAHRGREGVVHLSDKSARVAVMDARLEVTIRSRWQAEAALPSSPATMLHGGAASQAKTPSHAHPHPPTSVAATAACHDFSSMADRLQAAGQRGGKLVCIQLCQLEPLARLPPLLQHYHNLQMLHLAHVLHANMMPPSDPTVHYSPARRLQRCGCGGQVVLGFLQPPCQVGSLAVQRRHLPLLGFQLQHRSEVAGVHPRSATSQIQRFIADNLKEGTAPSQANPSRLPPGPLGCAAPALSQHPPAPPAPRSRPAGAAAPASRDQHMPPPEWPAEQEGLMINATMGRFSRSSAPGGLC